jgi:hypothetical protein
MPEELRDRETERWLGPPEVCRAILVALFEGLVAELRERERVLREHYEEPSRAGAEVREQVLRSPDGMQLARLEQMHQHDFNHAYQAFLRGRKETQKTGAAPGSPCAAVRDSAAQPFVPAPMTASEKAAGRRATKQAAAARKQAAGAAAPGGTNGIGAPLFTGDAMIAEVAARAPRPAEAAPGDPTGASIQGEH